MKHFTIGYKDSHNNLFEICEYAEKSEEAINNAMNDVPILKNNHNYIFRCTNESDLEWLSKMECVTKAKWDKESLSKEGRFVLGEIKHHLNHIISWIKISIKTHFEL